MRPFTTLNCPSSSVLATILTTFLILQQNTILVSAHASPLDIGALTAPAADTDKKDPDCTVTSPVTGSFIDLRPLTRTDEDNNWSAKGHDYNTNFTINICAPAVGSSEATFHAILLHSNVSAYYQKDGMKYSIGSYSHQPHFRGRKVILEYTGGSLCPKLDENGAVVEGHDNAEGFRKSALLAMTCDQTAIKQAAISFLGQLNECSYFFEVRTARACPTAKQQTLGPIAIFGTIAIIALLVYLVGGCVYQRTVMHARGWRQLPHHQTWSDAFGFVWDSLQSLLFSIRDIIFRRPRTGRMNSVDSEGGYLPASTEGGRFSARSYGQSNQVAGRNEWTDIDDENRLIDQLDEEWE